MTPEPPPGRIIPLFPGIARGSEDRRTLLRAAVIQVVGHLVERAVPPAQRDPLFDQARDLLDRPAGAWTNSSEPPVPAPGKTNCCGPWG